MSTFAPRRGRPARLVDPTGKPDWTRLLLSGPTGGRKSGTAALFTADERITRTVWVEIGDGERTANEYGAIPGARYSILQHDGTFLDIYEQLVDAYYQALDGETRGETWALVIDQMGGLNLMLQDMADGRARAKKAGPLADAGEDVSWIFSAEYDTSLPWELRSLIKKRHDQVMRIVRNWPGPAVLISAEDITTVWEGGKPTDRKDWALQCRRELPRQIDAWVRLEPGQAATVLKLRSVKEMLAADPLTAPYKRDDFTISKLVFDWVGCEAGVSRAPADIVYDADQDMPDEYHHGRTPPASQRAARQTADQLEERRRKARETLVGFFGLDDVDKAARQATWLAEEHPAKNSNILPYMEEDERERLGIRPEVQALTLAELGPYVVDYVSRHKRSVLAPLDADPATAEDAAPAADSAEIERQFHDLAEQMVRDDKRMMRDIVGN